MYVIQGFINLLSNLSVQLVSLQDLILVQQETQQTCRKFLPKALTVFLNRKAFAVNWFQFQLKNVVRFLYNLLLHHTSGQNSLMWDPHIIKFSCLRAAKDGLDLHIHSCFICKYLEILSMSCKLKLQESNVNSSHSLATPDIKLCAALEVIKLLSIWPRETHREKESPWDGILSILWSLSKKELLMPSAAAAAY